MSVEPKISRLQDIDKLRNCYVNKKMSTVDIEKASTTLFSSSP